MKERILLLGVLVAVWSAAHVTAATTVVDQAGSGAFTEIQSAIDAAADGDTVLVKAGEYVITEPITFKGKKITVRGEAGAKQTTIRMSETLTDPQRASVVIFESGEGVDSTLDGFTLTGGSGTGVPPGGGGVYCRGSSPSLTNCTISGNSAVWSCQRGGGWVPPYSISCGFGGGVTCSGGSPVLANCTISRNSAPHGGGFTCTGGASPTLTNCTISGNSCIAWIRNADGLRLSPNDAVGGGVYCGNSSLLLTSCTITGNTSGIGGGVYCGGDSSPALTNCIVWGNTPTPVCGALSNCTTDQDPLFVDPAAGDYHLQPGSPCIDTGTPVGAPTTDIEGYARPCGDGVDIGAYEFGHCAANFPEFKRGDTNSDNKIDVADAVHTLSYLFAHGPAMPCLDAADANDDGRINVADAITVLGHLFGNAGPLPAPFGSCGVDPTLDDVPCLEYEPCKD